MANASFQRKEFMNFICFKCEFTEWKKSSRNMRIFWFSRIRLLWIFLLWFQSGLRISQAIHYRLQSQHWLKHNRISIPEGISQMASLRVFLLRAPILIMSRCGWLFIVSRIFPGYQELIRWGFNQLLLSYHRYRNILNLCLNPWLSLFES